MAFRLIVPGPFEPNSDRCGRHEDAAAALPYFAGPRLLIALAAALAVPPAVLAGGLRPAAGAALMILILQAVPASIALSQGDWGRSRGLSTAFFPLVCLAAAALSPAAAVAAACAAALLPVEAATWGEDRFRRAVLAAAPGALLAAAGIARFDPYLIPQAAAAAMAATVGGSALGHVLGRRLRGERERRADLAARCRAQTLMCPEPMLWLTSAGTLSDANAAGRMLLPEHVAQGDWMGALHPVDRAAFSAALGLALPGRGSVSVGVRIDPSNVRAESVHYRARLLGVQAEGRADGRIICVVLSPIPGEVARGQGVRPFVSGYDEGADADASDGPTVVSLARLGRGVSIETEQDEEVSRRA